MKKASKENPALVSMTLTDEIAKKVKETFNLEVEMLSGEIQKLPDGRTKYKFEVSCPDKAELLKKFMLQIFSTGHKINNN